MKKRRRWGGGGRARRTIFNYAENALAEMATVLRKDATILIRLREKMEVHLCTVFHSTRNPIILKRYAVKLRMMQEHDKNPTIEFHTNDTMNIVQNAIEIRGLAQVV